MSQLSIAVVDAQSIRPRVLLQPLGIWMVMAILAILNGVFRESVIVPRIDEYSAHVLSTALLIGAILVVSFLFFTNTPIRFTTGELVVIGVVWAGLTVGFEFLVGYLEGTPVGVTLGQYNVFAGQVWVFVILALLLSPLVFGWYIAR